MKRADQIVVGDHLFGVVKVRNENTGGVAMKYGAVVEVISVQQTVYPSGFNKKRVDELVGMSPTGDPLWVSSYILNGYYTITPNLTDYNRYTTVKFYHPSDIPSNAKLRWLVPFYCPYPEQPNCQCTDGAGGHLFTYGDGQFYRYLPEALTQQTISITFSVKYSEIIDTPLFAALGPGTWKVKLSFAEHGSGTSINRGYSGHLLGAAKYEITR